MEGLGGFLIFGLGLAVYLLPTIVGSSKSNIGAIFVLNLFLGWTLIGWVVALVWAMTNDEKPIQAGAKANRYDQLQKLDELRTNGVITTEEFIAEKEKVMRA
jgi:hypothetical protein